MPFATLRYRPGCMPNKSLEKLVKVLTHIIAEALDAPKDQGNRLTPERIELKVEEGNPLDQNCKDIHLVVWGHNYPARLANQDVRVNAIRGAIRVFFSDYDYSVSWSVHLNLCSMEYD